MSVKMTPFLILLFLFCSNLTFAQATKRKELNTSESTAEKTLVKCKSEKFYQHYCVQDYTQQFQEKGHDDPCERTNTGTVCFYPQHRTCFTAITEELSRAQAIFNHNHPEQQRIASQKVEGLGETDASKPSSSDTQASVKAYEQKAVEIEPVIKSTEACVRKLDAVINYLTSDKADFTANRTCSAQNNWVSGANDKSSWEVTQSFQVDNVLKNTNFAKANSKNGTLEKAEALKKECENLVTQATRDKQTYLESAGGLKGHAGPDAGKGGGKTLEEDRAALKARLDDPKNQDPETIKLREYVKQNKVDVSKLSAEEITSLQTNANGHWESHGRYANWSKMEDEVAKDEKLRTYLEGPGYDPNRPEIKDMTPAQMDQLKAESKQYWADQELAEKSWDQFAAGRAAGDGKSPPPGSQAPPKVDPQAGGAAAPADQRSWLSRNKWGVVAGVVGVAGGATAGVMVTNNKKKKKKKAHAERTEFYEKCIADLSKRQTVVDPVVDCKNWQPRN